MFKFSVIAKKVYVIKILPIEVKPFLQNQYNGQSWPGDASVDMALP